MDNIQGFKTMNGMEIVANLLEETETHYKLENAVLYEFFAVGDPSEGKVDVRLLPLSYGVRMPINQDHYGMEVDMPKTSIMFKFQIRTEIADRLKQLCSPIVLLTK